MFWSFFSYDLVCKKMFLIELCSSSSCTRCLSGFLNFICMLPLVHNTLGYELCFVAVAVQTCMLRVVIALRFCHAAAIVGFLAVGLRLQQSRSWFAQWPAYKMENMKLLMKGGMLAGSLSAGGCCPRKVYDQNWPYVEGKLQSSGLCWRATNTSGNMCCSIRALYRWQ